MLRLASRLTLARSSPQLASQNGQPPMQQLVLYSSAGCTSPWQRSNVSVTTTTTTTTTATRIQRHQLHSTAALLRRRGKEALAEDIPVSKSQQRTEGTPDTYQTAASYARENRGKATVKSLAKKEKALKKSRRKALEHHKLTGKWPDRMAQTGATFTGTAQVAKDNRRKSQMISAIRDHSRQEEANLPPPGVAFDQEAANRRPEKVSLRDMLTANQDAPRDKFVPLVFGSRDRKPNRSYQRRIDQLRTAVGKLKTQHPFGISPGKRAMSSSGDLVKYSLKLSRTLASNQRAKEQFVRSLRPDQYIVPPTRTTREAIKPRKPLVPVKKDKEVAVAAVAQSPKAVAAQARLEALLEAAEAMRGRDALQRLPLSDVKTKVLLEKQRHLESITHGERHMVSDKRGLERQLLARMKKQEGSTRFHDCVYVFVRSGSGGQGRQSSRSLGGDGGDVFVEAVRGVSLDGIANLEVKRFNAQVGGPADVTKLKGRRGNDLILSVPMGTVVSRVGAPDVKLADLNADKQKVLVARGGQGGSVFSEPAWGGAKGDSCRLRLELKMLADIGLVGFPNAGKSTLLSRMSRTQPTIANFPFTTIRPQIGQINYSSGELVSMADLPGLIEGAHKNVGLGHRFLRHLERCKVLLFLVDINGFQLSLHDFERSPKEVVDILADELEMYKEGLSYRPAVLCITKMDSPGAVEKCGKLLEELKDHMVEGATMPDLSQYKDFAADAPLNPHEELRLSAGSSLHLGNEELPELAERAAERMEAKSQAEEELSAAERLQAAVEHMNEEEEERISDVPVAPTQQRDPFSSAATDADLDMLQAPVGAKASASSSPVMQTTTMGAARDDVARARLQREQLRSMAMSSGGGAEPGDYIDPERTPYFPDVVGAQEPSSGDAELKTFLSLADSQTALEKKKKSDADGLNDKTLAVLGRRRKNPIKFQQIIPISCHRELQGLDFLYIAMRGIVKAARQDDRPKIDFSSAARQIRQEPAGRRDDDDEGEAAL